MKTTVWHEQSDRTGFYSVRWYNPETGHKERCFCPTFKEAQKKKASLKIWLLNKKAGLGATESQTSEIFEHYISWCERHDYRPATIQFKRDNLGAFAQKIQRLKDITEENLDVWKRDLEKKYKPMTVKIKLTECRAFLNWCVRQKYLTESPFHIKIIVPNTVRRKVSPNEMALLESKMDERFKLYFYLIADHGTRRTETLLTEWAHIDLNGGTWTIPAHITKGHQERTIPLSNRTLEALKGCLEQSGRLFKGWNKTTPRHYLNKARLAVENDLGIKLDKVHPHLFRHTRASNWRGNIYALMDYMGWRSFEMGKRYSHFNVEDLRKEASK